MSWFSISFDGEGLAYARVTRHDRSGTVHMVVGKPYKGPDGTIYPTAARLDGFRRVKVDEILGLLSRQYGDASAEPDGDGTIIFTDMPAKRLWADALTNLRAFESLFDPPVLRIRDGRVTMFVKAVADLPEASIRGRLQGAAPAADVYSVEGFDGAAWDGLEPRIIPAT